MLSVTHSLYCTIAVASSYCSIGICFENRKKIRNATETALHCKRALSLMSFFERKDLTDYNENRDDIKGGTLLFD